MTEPVYIESAATFDPQRIYRYSLVRRWKPGGFSVLFIMLNPSTADETVLDPTLRRCLGFTQLWKVLGIHAYNAFSVCNLYAFRSTDPKNLFHPRQVFNEQTGLVETVAPPDDPVGPDNDAVILECAKAADLVVVGWGDNAKPERERKVAQMLADAHIKPMALRLTKSGSPGHPLYLPANTPLFPWHCKGLR